MKSKLVWLETLLVFAPVVFLAVFWSSLPARVPIHWNLAGEVDRWSGKGRLFLAPLLALGVFALLHLLPRLDPKLRRTLSTGRMPDVVQIFGVALALFFCLLFALQVFVAFDHSIPATRILFSAILVLLAIVGNYSGNLRPNYFIGIRTPWTLESADTWRATHRLGGRLIFFGALLLLVLQFWLNESAFAFVVTAAALGLVLWSFVYSWRHFRTHASDG